METKAHKVSRLKERGRNSGSIGMPIWVARLFISVGQAVVVLLVLFGHVSAESVGSSGPPANVVKGDVLNIEGETYIIKDLTGHEVSLRVNGETKHEDRIKVGDKVHAQVGSDGVAQSIRVPQPDDGASPRIQ
jgi:hypothetical protein